MKQNMILLHGLFGELSNWDRVVDRFGSSYNVFVPPLPICEASREDPMYSLVGYLEEFVEHRNLRDLILVGNSLGGHVAILYALRHAGKVRHLVLTGSSGLYENTSMGSFPRRNSLDYIKERVEYTFL